MTATSGRLDNSQRTTEVSWNYADEVSFMVDMAHLENETTPPYQSRIERSLNKFFALTIWGNLHLASTLVLVHGLMFLLPQHIREGIPYLASFIGVGLVALSRPFMVSFPTAVFMGAVSTLLFIPPSYSLDIGVAGWSKFFAYLVAMTFLTVMGNLKYRAHEAARVLYVQHQAKLALADRESKRRDEFLAMLSHELRNPLASITNAVQLLEMDSSLGGETRQNSMAIVKRQVKHMTTMIEDLLDLSRLSRGKIALRKEVVDLNVVVNQVIAGLKPLIDTRGHDVQTSLALNQALVWGDATRIDQVISNLLTNAVKYTEPHGRITIRVSVNGTTASVRIRDNGIGISENMLPRIFDLFSQADRTLDRAQGGLGIGLTLVRNLVELHGGSVQAFSAGLGQGSEFVVSFPLSKGMPIEATRPVPAIFNLTTITSEVPRRNFKILVVDDNKDAANTMQLILEGSGHMCDVAYDGPSAIQKAEGVKPDIILLDIGLPGMDGYEVAQYLRTKSTIREVVIFALTGYGYDKDRKRSEEVGIDLHLVKPVEPNALENWIQSSKGTRKVLK
jgi:signal transduction histidine kinase/ActR/RegA family two-component response regulator